MEHDASLAGAHDSAPMRRVDRTVVLVGLMGVGKSTVGRRLAALLQVPFVDADEEIERAAQMSVTEIFEKYGEAYFRDGERRVIARLIAQDVRRVVATGGGAFVNAETRALILERAIAVWLDSDLDTLVERTARRNHRPLLQGGDPRAVLARLKAEREPAYAEAQIHVCSTAGPHDRTVEAIVEALAQWR